MWYCYFFGDFNVLSDTKGLTYYELEIQLLLMVSIFAFFYEGLGYNKKNCSNL